MPKLTTRTLIAGLSLAVLAGGGCLQQLLAVTWRGWLSLAGDGCGWLATTGARRGAPTQHVVCWRTAAARWRAQFVVAGWRRRQMVAAGGRKLVVANTELKTLRIVKPLSKLDLSEGDK